MVIENCDLCGHEMDDHRFWEYGGGCTVLLCECRAVGPQNIKLSIKKGDKEEPLPAVGGMSSETRNRVFSELFEDIVQKAVKPKGDAYSGGGDVLSNFKRNAERLGLTKYQIWAVYFAKHIDAIMNSIANSPEKPVDKSEGMDGRIMDAMTYLGLLKCLLSEDI